MKLLTSQIAGIAAATCALVASPVRAAPSGQVPLPIGLHANAQYEAGGRPLVLRFPVTAGKPKKGVQIFDEERAEAEATRSVVVSGQISDTIEGRELRLEIDGPKIDDSQRKLTARLIKDGDKGTQNSACYVKWDTKSHCPGED